MGKVIKVNDTYELHYAYDCDSNYSFYDIYDDTGWIGELPESYVESCLVDETEDVYDENELERIIEDYTK